MPLIDMPLQDLLKYEGRNPRPADHDEYWQRALSELDRTEAKVDLEPVDFPTEFAECFQLTFTGVGGSRVSAKYIRPKGKKNCPCLLQFHGYTWYSGDWAGKMGYVANGYAVLAMDCRGQGGDSMDHGTYDGMTVRGQIVRGLEGHPDGLYFRNVYLDCAQAARIVSDLDEIDSTRLGAMGGSQGGGLTLACAALAPHIKKAAPVYPFLCDFKRIWEMDLAKDAYDDIKYFFKMRDPRHERADEYFTKLGYIDLQFLAPRIKAEVKLFAGLMDTITPPSSYFAAYNKMTCEKSYVIYPDFGHEGLIGSDDIIWRFFSDL